jgi:hypothetical protein
VRFVGEVQPAPGAAVLIGGWGIRVRARTARWVAGCAAAGSVALIGGGLALAYLDRHLLSASLTNWTVSNVSGQVVNVAVPVTGFVLASRRPENRIGWLFLVAGLGLATVSFANPYALHALVADPGSLPARRALAWLGYWIWQIPVAMLAFLFLLFPTGYVRSRRWLPAAWFVGVAFALATGAAHRRHPLVGAPVRLVRPGEPWSDPVARRDGWRPVQCRAAGQRGGAGGQVRQVLG